MTISTWSPSTVLAALHPTWRLRWIRYLDLSTLMMHVHAPPPLAYSCTRQVRSTAESLQQRTFLRRHLVDVSYSSDNKGSQLRQPCTRHRTLALCRSLRHVNDFILWLTMIACRMGELLAQECAPAVPGAQLHRFCRALSRQVSSSSVAHVAPAAVAFIAASMIPQLHAYFSSAQLAVRVQEKSCR
jgi:hypothetical protein